MHYIGKCSMVLPRYSSKCHVNTVIHEFQSTTVPHFISLSLLALGISCGSHLCFKYHNTVDTNESIVNSLCEDCSSEHWFREYLMRIILD